MLANDSDVDGDPITVSAVGGPAHGSATLATTGPNAGRISYLPSPNFVGTDVFTYTITDGHGGTATATVSVTVTAVNRGPIAMNDVVTLLEDTVAVVDVRSNDRDPDGDVLSLSAVTQAAHGIVEIANAHMIGAMRLISCLLYTSPSPRDRQKSRMPSSA